MGGGVVKKPTRWAPELRSFGNMALCTLTWTYIPPAMILSIYAPSLSTNFFYRKG